MDYKCVILTACLHVHVLCSAIAAGCKCLMCPGAVLLYIVHFPCLFSLSLVPFLTAAYASVLYAFSTYGHVHCLCMQLHVCTYLLVLSDVVTASLHAPQRCV